jgi:hypothetical protein
MTTMPNSRDDCAECRDFYRGIPTPKHDLELGCAPDCPCQHEHRTETWPSDSRDLVKVPVEAVDAVRDELPYWLVDGKNPYDPSSPYRPHIEDETIRKGLARAVPHLQHAAAARLQSILDVAVTPHKSPYDSDASMLQEAADCLAAGSMPGWNVSITAAMVLRAVADVLEMS